MKRFDVNRHECSEIVLTARPLKCRHQKLRNSAARPLKVSERTVPALEVRVEFEKSVKDFLQAVTNDRHFCSNSVRMRKEFAQALIFM